MIVIMNSDASANSIETVIQQIESHGYQAHFAQDTQQITIGFVGGTAPLNQSQITRLDGVSHVRPFAAPYKLASRDFQSADSAFSIGQYPVGGKDLLLMAGPCAIESRSQIIETAYAVKEAGAQILRGGAYKPRTSPYSFSGLGVKGLEYLAEAGELTNMPVITEVMEPELVPVVSEYADVLQLGTRNMQNYALLKAVGRSQTPVLLKRGMSGTIEEWLLCAEYILSEGNKQVMLCERGIRTYESATRNTFDINAIPVVKQCSHLPLIADPSHATGKREYVAAVARASIAAGADGLILEVHPRPEDAISDGRQTLTPDHFARLVHEMRAIAQAVNRDLASPAFVAA